MVEFLFYLFLGLVLIGAILFVIAVCVVQGLRFATIIKKEYLAFKNLDQRR